MELEVVEGFSNGKFLGLFHSDQTEPPKQGETLELGSLGRVRVKECSRTRSSTYYRVIVKRL